MRFSGIHESRWRFSRPVFLEPHLVRLVPRTDAAQRLNDFALEVWPEPAGRSQIEDAEGNRVWRLWFEGLHGELAIATRFTAHTLRVNPFDYLLDSGALRLPPVLSGAERAALAPYLAPPPRSGLAAGLGRKVLASVDGDPARFLSELNARLHAMIRVTPRETPGIQCPDQTLGGGCGACRDVALAFLAACRGVGLPARYASCYQQGDPDQDGHDLHACAEAYLPGAGWRGFDPTLGLAVADAHLLLCVSSQPELTAPVAGSFRGTGAEASMEFSVRLDVRPDGG